MTISFVNTARRALVAAMVGGALVMALPANALAYSSQGPPVVTGATCTYVNSSSSTVTWTWSTSAGKPTEARVTDPVTTNVLSLVQKFTQKDLTSASMTRTISGNQSGKTVNVVMKNKAGTSAAVSAVCS